MQRVMITTIAEANLPMKAFINIPKRSGSCIITRNAAILDAIKRPTTRGLSNSWKLEGSGSEFDAMQAARTLRERLQMSSDELRERPHTTFADLEASGVFGGMIVLERRGYWRVEVLGL